MNKKNKEKKGLPKKKLQAQNKERMIQQPNRNVVPGVS